MCGNQFFLDLLARVGESTNLCDVLVDCFETEYHFIVVKKDKLVVFDKSSGQEVSFSDIDKFLKANK